jgi:hypothetical protein
MTRFMISALATAATLSTSFGHPTSEQTHAPWLAVRADSGSVACSRLATTYANTVVTSENEDLYTKAREAHW